MTGGFFDPPPEQLAEKIEFTINNLERYNPREYVINNTGKTNSIKKLKVALEKLCFRDGQDYIFDSIDWDGRNQSLIWGRKALEILNKYSNR